VSITTGVFCALTHKSDLTRVLDINYSDNSFAVCTQAWDGTDSQLWSFEDLGDGYYKIVQSLDNHPVLDGDASGKIYTNQWSDSSDSQGWSVLDAGNGYISIQQKGTKLVLDGNDNGKVYSNPPNPGDYQRWSFTPEGVIPDYNALGNLYPGGWNAMDTGAAYGDLTCADFTSADSNYRTKKPSWRANNDGTETANGSGTAVMEMDHVKTASTDDHATLTVDFLPSGKVEAASITWESGSLPTIPPWAEKVAAAAVGGTVALISDLLSDGVALPADKEIYKEASDDVKMICDAWNHFANLVNNYDDGGRLNFIAVVTHNFNKLSSSMKVTPPPATPSNTISFSLAKFSAGMGFPWTDSGDNAMLYDESYEGNSSKYRTWKQDSSVFRCQAGLYVTTKVDHIRKDDYDDHIIIMLAFSSNGTLIAAQAAVQFNEFDPKREKPAPYVTKVYVGNDANGKSPADQVVDEMNSKREPKYKESNSGRQNIPNVASINMVQMIKAVVWSAT